MKVLLPAILTLLPFTGINVTKAAQITIPAFSDGEIDSAGVLGVTAETSAPSIRTSRSGNSNIHHGAFVFDLSSIPEEANITSVDFRVSLAGLISNTSETANVEFHGFASDNVIEATDFDLPTSSVASLLASETFPAGAASSPPIGSTVSIPLSTELFQDILEGSDPFMTLRSETVNFVTFHVNSLENEVGALPPALVINAENVPEPSTIVGLLVLLGGMTIARRGRSAN